MIEGQETKVMSVRDAIIEAMSEEMRRDENVFLMGEDVGVYGGDFGTSVGMLEEFGSERVRDTPISENAISGCAVGAALTGMRPIVDVTFMDFVVYMMDNIVNQAAKTRYMYGGKGSVPVVFRCAAGSGLGSAAQHSQSLESWFCHIPGLKVVAPGTPADVKGLLKAAIRDNNPVIFLEYKAQYNMRYLPLLTLSCLLARLISSASVRTSPWLPMVVCWSASSRLLTRLLRRVSRSKWLTS